MKHRSLLLASLAGLLLSACVDSRRPTSGAGNTCAPDLFCSPDQVPTDQDGDGCPDTCEQRPCASSCDCIQPTTEESDELCPAKGWPGYGLYRVCEDQLCQVACGAKPTEVLNCDAHSSCPESPECAPWELPSLDPTTGCVTRCDTRCDLDCDCYAALGTPDDPMVWRCTDHTCDAEEGGRLALQNPDCHGKKVKSCKTSSDCLGDGGILDSRNYCAHPPGMCEATQGVCTDAGASTLACFDDDPAVCGCDDKIYDNICDAIEAGVSARGPASMCPIPVGG